MAEFEDRLNDILSSPEKMQQVAQLAQMFSSQAENNDSPDHSGTPPPASPPDEPSQQCASSMTESASQESGSGFDLSSLLGGIDMNTIARFLPLIQEMNSSHNDERTRLLYALKPFLKQERQEKIDTALRLARLFHVGKTFFKGFGERHV